MKLESNYQEKDFAGAQNNSIEAVFVFFQIELWLRKIFDLQPTLSAQKQKELLRLHREVPHRSLRTKESS